ncbi:MAG: hypothetical protein IJ329_03595 [Clostridia bacterium]|nr:hypothetical protein [Clostridia bacterium]
MTKSKNKKLLIALCAMAAACSIGAVTTLASVSADETATDTGTTASNVTAVYSDETNKTSATIDSLNITEFSALTDFTDWFALGNANSTQTLSDYVTYDETNKSVTISNTAQTGLDFRFHPDGTIGSDGYYGKTQLGNFEIKMTVRGLNVGDSENMYMASRGQWDSSGAEYMNLRALLTGKEDGKHNLGANQSYVSGVGKGAAYENLDTSNGITLTVGYVNNYMYFYHGDYLENGYNVVKASIAENTANSARDGNQTFALFFTGSGSYATEMEILDFSYERLDEAFAFDATDETSLAAITTRLAVPETPSNEYADELDFDFTNADNATANQAFIDGLSAGTSTYSETGTEYTHELTADGLVMQNTTTNRHGLSYLSLATEQYENSAIQLSLNVAEESVFELYVRTAANATGFAYDGYHLLIERTGNYTYLKLESRKSSWASFINNPQYVSLPSGEVSLMMVTEKVVDGDNTYTKLTVYTGGTDPVISVTDEVLAEANKCDASLGNIAFAVRNQGNSAGKVTIEKMAIYKDPAQATWPRKDYSGVSVVSGIDDMYYEFGANDEENASAQEFIDKLSIVNVSPKAEGTIGIADNGYVEMKHNALGQYYRTQYEFGALNLTNYTVMMELEVIEGSFVLGVRVPTFQDFTAGNTVYIQLSNNGDGSGLYLSMVNRTNGTYSSYFTSYNTGSNSVSLRLIVEGGRVSILVEEKLCLYNAYYVDEDGVRDWDVDGYNNYDKTVATSGGDFVMAVMNDLKTDIASTQIKRFAFYNGANAEENVAYNYADEELDEATRAELIAEAEKNMLFTDGFFIPFTAEIGLSKQYDGKTNFSVGDTIRINISEYFSMNVLTSEVTVTEMGFRGNYSDGVWSYTFTEADKDKDFAFALTVTHAKATTPVVLRINVSTKAAAGADDSDSGSSSEGGCSGCGSVIDLASGGVCLLAVGAAFLLKKKKEN